MSNTLDTMLSLLQAAIRSAGKYPVIELVRDGDYLKIFLDDSHVYEKNVNMTGKDPMHLFQDIVDIL